MRKVILYLSILFCIGFSGLYTYKQLDRNVSSFLQKNFESMESYEYKISLSDFPHLQIKRGVIKIEGSISVHIVSDIDVYHLKNGEFLLYLSSPQFQFKSAIYTADHLKTLCRNLYIGIHLDENYKMIFKRFDMQDFYVNEAIQIKTVIGKLNNNSIGLFSTPLMKDQNRNNFISLEIKHTESLQYQIQIESSHAFEWLRYINSQEFLGDRKYNELKENIKTETIFQNFNYEKGQFLLKIEPAFW